ncbi:MAG: pyridoxamine 5'-phosphate oxidase family protein [bacterium]
MALPRKRTDAAKIAVARERTPAIRPRSASGPVIRALRPAECLAMLRRSVVGRMAFSFHDRVDITPIHYVYADGWLYARTSHGAKMTTLRHSQWMAFEVDEVDGLFDWRSVVVHGTVHAIEPDEGPHFVRWQKGVALLRKLIPETETVRDPVPFRSIVFGIFIDSMSGRVSSSGRKGVSRRK